MITKYSVSYSLSDLLARYNVHSDGTPDASNGFLIGIGYGATAAEMSDSQTQSAML